MCPAEEKKWHSTSNIWLLCPGGSRLFWNFRQIAGAPSLKARLSWLFTWQVSTMGCENSFIMNMAVSFGFRPKMVWQGYGADFLSGDKFHVSDGLCHCRPSFLFGQHKVWIVWPLAAVHPDGVWLQQITIPSLDSNWFWRIIQKEIQCNPSLHHDIYHSQCSIPLTPANNPWHHHTHFSIKVNVFFFSVVWM